MNLIKNCKYEKWKVKGATIFFEIWHLEQMQHANYEYSTWNWWYQPKIIDSGKCGPKIEMRSNFHETWLLGYF